MGGTLEEPNLIPQVLPVFEFSPKVILRIISPVLFFFWAIGRWVHTSMH